MKRTIAAVLLAAIPAIAHAHPGHPAHGVDAFTAGAAHPFTGVDHLLAMAATGMLAARIGGRAHLALPLAFAGAMLTGFFLALPFAEHAIALSLIFAGGLLALRKTVTPTLAAAFAIGAGLFHGAAHGAELPATAGCTAGVVLATLALHFVGLFAGRALIATSRVNWLRTAGACIAASAVFFA